MSKLNVVEVQRISTARHRNYLVDFRRKRVGRLQFLIDKSATNTAVVINRKDTGSKLPPSVAICVAYVSRQLKSTTFPKACKKNCAVSACGFSCMGGASLKEGPRKFYVRLKMQEAPVVKRELLRVQIYKYSMAEKTVSFSATSYKSLPISSATSSRPRS